MQGDIAANSLARFLHPSIFEKGPRFRKDGIGFSFEGFRLRKFLRRRSGRAGFLTLGSNFLCNRGLGVEREPERA